MRNALGQDKTSNEMFLTVCKIFHTFSQIYDTHPATEDGDVIQRKKRLDFVDLDATRVADLFFAGSSQDADAPPSLSQFHALILCVVLLVAIEVVAHVVVAMRAPKDAQAPKDERERLIALKAVYISAHVFAVGSLLTISSIHIGANAIFLANGIVLSFVIAQIVKYGARINYYRRGV